MKKIFLGIILFILASSIFAQSQVMADIQILDIKHNYKENDENGMRIHCKITVNGCAGHELSVAAFFCNKDGSKNYGNIPGHRTADGQTATWKDRKAIYDNTVWEDEYLFLPYNVLKYSKGTNLFRYDIWLRDKTNNYRELTHTECQWFYVDYRDSPVTKYDGHNWTTGIYAKGSDDIRDMYVNKYGKGISSINAYLVIDSIARRGEKRLHACNGGHCSLVSTKSQIIGELLPRYVYKTSLSIDYINDYENRIRDAKEWKRGEYTLCYLSVPGSGYIIHDGIRCTYVVFTEKKGGVQHCNLITDF